MVGAVEVVRFDFENAGCVRHGLGFGGAHVVEGVAERDRDVILVGRWHHHIFGGVRLCQIVDPHIDDQHGRVVASSVEVGELHQGSCCVAHFGVLVENGVDLLVRDFVGEPVAAQDVAVACLGFDFPFVDFDLSMHTDRPGQHVAVGVVGGLFGVDVASAHQLGHIAVVVRELMQHPPTLAVDAGIAHVDQPEVRAAFVGDHCDGGQGCAHSVELWAGDRGVVHHLVGRMDCGTKALAAVMFCARNGADSEIGRDLTTLVPAHPVRDDEQAAVREHGVLIGSANPTLVGGAAPGEAKMAGFGHVGDRSAWGIMWRPRTPWSRLGSGRRPSTRWLSSHSGG